MPVHQRSGKTNEDNVPLPSKLKLAEGKESTAALSHPLFTHFLGSTCSIPVTQFVQRTRKYSSASTASYLVGAILLQVEDDTVMMRVFDTVMMRVFDCWVLRMLIALEL
jgi:hypothetical protein